MTTNRPRDARRKWLRRVRVRFLVIGGAAVTAAAVASATEVGRGIGQAITRWFGF